MNIEAYEYLNTFKVKEKVFDLITLFWTNDNLIF